MADTDTQTTNRFAQLTFQQKISLGVGVAALIALFAGMWLWEQTPDYRVLYSNLSDRDGGAIVDSLQQLNIPYKFAEGGGALMVPSNQVHEARLKLASQGLPKGGSVGFELMDNQRFGITQFAEQVNFQRALEGELARSVQTIGSVASARVHLAIPKPSVFVKDQQQPSASVILSLHNGRLLDSAQVSAIIHLISSSVPQMSAKNVTVVDQNGTLLSANHEGAMDGLDASQLKYVQKIEQNYMKRIEDILSPMLGDRNVRAQVTADIDFSRTEQTAESYKPNQNPADSTVRSQQTNETLNGSGLSASGIPGALTNQPPVSATAPIVANNSTPANAAANNGNISNLQKESTINYEVDRTIRHTQLPVGMIKRISVAVLVNGARKITDAKGKVIDKPFSDAEKEQINNLVRDAMGYDQNRGDSVNVQIASFNQDKESIEELPLWKQPDIIELAKVLVKYLLIGLIALVVILKIIKPAFAPLMPTPEPSADDHQDNNGEGQPTGEHGATGISSETGSGGANSEGNAGEAAIYTPSVAPYEQNLQIARQITQQDPKIVASVIKEWVNGNE